MLPLLDAMIQIDALHKPDDVAGFMDGVQAIVALVAIFGMPVFIVVAVQMFRSRRLRMVHEVVLKLAEKGQPVPPELFRESEMKKSDVRNGLTLIGIGLGVATGFYLSGSTSGVGWALIPAFMGLARLIAWKIDRDQQDR